ncbi:hypothetical protein DSAG12_03886 [Promethearchaeum syntrophicum]|uniref:Uncharacterized protein n=1 Tax=Promethearchaeum syntrophicum TaxID=2594042 RepID=A0A5B9DFI6_9ARCH|nr:hypothetical protein [Candidatus Prometheoarchaeum syntrophicum]
MGSKLSDGEIGYICFSGLQVSLGYMKDEKNTHLAISTNIFCYTAEFGFNNEGDLKQTIKELERELSLFKRLYFDLLEKTER